MPNTLPDLLHSALASLRVLSRMIVVDSLPFTTHLQFPVLCFATRAKSASYTQHHPGAQYKCCDCFHNNLLFVFSLLIFKVKNRTLLEEKQISARTLTQFKYLRYSDKLKPSTKIRKPYLCKPKKYKVCSH